MMPKDEQSAFGTTNRNSGLHAAWRNAIRATEAFFSGWGDLVTAGAGQQPRHSVACGKPQPGVIFPRRTCTTEPKTPQVTYPGRALRPLGGGLAVGLTCRRGSARRLLPLAVYAIQLAIVGSVLFSTASVGAQAQEPSTLEASHHQEVPIEPQPVEPAPPQLTAAAAPSLDASPSIQTAPGQGSETYAIDDRRVESMVDAPPGRDSTRLWLGIAATVLGGVSVYVGGVLLAGPALQTMGGEQCHGEDCLSNAEKVAAPCLLIGGAVALIGGVVLIKSSSKRHDTRAGSESHDVRIGVGATGARLQLNF